MPVPTWAGHTYYHEIVICLWWGDDECENNSPDEAEECDNAPWEDHPYYDTPDDEEKCKTKFDDLEENDDVFQDNFSYMEEEELKWEKSH